VEVDEILRPGEAGNPVGDPQLKVLGPLRLLLQDNQGMPERPAARFWASDGVLVHVEYVISSGLREAAQLAGGTVTRERYEVPVFESEASLRAVQGVRMTRMSVEPSKL